MAMVIMASAEMLVDTRDGTDLEQGGISTEQENYLYFSEIYLQF